MAPSAGPLHSLQETQIKAERVEDSVWNVPAANLTTGAATPQHRGWHSVPHPLSSADMLRTGFRVLMDGNYASNPFFMNDRDDLVLNPGLTIRGVGPVGIPISPLVAEPTTELYLGASTPGTTSSQESVPRICELNVSQFLLRNPLWHSQATLLMRKLLTRMLDDKTPLDVRLELDKCLLIPPGASFIQDQPQQTTASIFGTMAICLPSKHEGGDIVVSYRGQSQTFSPSHNTEFSFSYAAWSVFAEPAGKPVTSGHQLMLTYKLIHSPTFIDLKYRHEGAASLTDLLSSWSKWAESKIADFHTEGLPPKLWFSRALESTSGPRLPALFHQLKDWYFTSDLGFDALIGQDKRQITKLRMACDASNCRVLLANMVQHIEGPVDLHSPRRRLAEGEFNNIKPIMFRRLELYHITDVDNKVLITAVETRKELCAYDVDVKLTGAPEEDVPLQAASAGPLAASQTFTHTIAIIIPASFYLPLLLDAAGKPPDDRIIYNIRPLWGKFHQAFLTNPEDQKTRTQLSELCNIVVANQKWLEWLIDDVVWVALDLGNFEAVKRCLDSRRELAEVWTASFGKVIYTRGIECVQPAIDHLWSLVSSSPVGHIGSLARMRSIWTDPSAQHTPDKAMEWYERTLDMLFCRLEQKDPAYLGTAEGLDLAVAVPHFPGPFFDSRVVPFANKMTSKTCFIIPFLTLLHREHEKGSARFPTFPAVYRSLVPAIIQDFSAFTCRSPQYPQTFKPDQLINGTHIAWLIEQSREIGLDMAEVLSTLERKINGIQRDHDIFPLFTTRLVSILCENLREKHQSNSSAAAASEEGAFVVRLVKFYLTPSADPCPPLPSDWRQSLPNLKPDCCLDCAELRRFVEDPVERQKEFRMIEQRRLHIETRLSDHFIFYTIREGSPHALRIVKTHGEALKRRYSWMERGTKQRAKLETLNQKVLLHETLGDHAYQDICACVADPAAGTALDTVQTGSQPPTPYGLTQANIQAQSRLHSPLKPAPVMSRKRSFVDLENEADGAENFPSTCKRR